ncbi:uncharacterized protein PAC_04336 [Phialocephala subalpina]|uniref:DRBM domain-containing protein n=1 Tax=Phialocephala subalpina TaxID=576137 RepID=A0A1L7WNV9_9HELO|nr:uncharacterized protein PAC_04336 [Phialocephala subalpina]
MEVVMNLNPQPSEVVKVAPTSYQSMDEYMKEQDELDQQLKQSTGSPQGPPAKKQRKSISLNKEELAFERKVEEVLGDENWIGTLQRYSDVNPNHKLKYEEVPVGQPVTRFQCLLTIRGISERFGSTHPELEPQNVAFSTKKLAKRYAAKQAIDYLIANGHMPDDGSVKFVKSAPPALPSPQQFLNAENWIGLLLEYSQAHPDHKVHYEERIISVSEVRFQCTVTIDGFPGQFGDIDLETQQNAVFTTKKIAKQYASKQAIDWLVANKHMPGDGTVKFANPALPLPPSELDLEQTAIRALGEENWIGLLQLFCDAHSGRKPRYEEIISRGGVPRFQYTLTIDGFPEQFGYDRTFSSKKLAKQYAAKQAVDWLIANSHIPSDGTVKPAKTKSTSTVPQPKAAFSQGEKHTALIPKLANRLGYQPPTYVLTPVTNGPSCPLWDGYAEFAEKQSIGDEGKVGHVRNVFGKENARQEIAKNVHTFLKDIEDHKLSMYEEEDKKRKRSTSISQDEVMDGTATTVEA